MWVCVDGMQCDIMSAKQLLQSPFHLFFYSLSLSLSHSLTHSLTLSLSSISLSFSLSLSITTTFLVTLSCTKHPHPTTTALNLIPTETRCPLTLEGPLSGFTNMHLDRGSTQPVHSLDREGTTDKTSTPLQVHGNEGKGFWIQIITEV